MGYLPRARPEASGGDDDRAGDGRPAQRLPPGRGRARRLRLFVERKVTSPRHAGLVPASNVTRAPKPFVRAEARRRRDVPRHLFTRRREEYLRPIAPPP